jgi:hypothetical protein
MAFYIKLRKPCDDANAAKYCFESDYENFGSLAIDKLSGQVTLLEPLPGDDKTLFFLRAAARIRKEWKDGRLPSEVEWAS